MSVEVAGLNCSTSIPRMNTATAPPMMKIRFIFRCYERLYFKLKRAADGIGECYEPIYPPDACRTVRIGVVDNAYRAAFARRNGLISGRDIPHARHAERPLGTTILPHKKGGRAHAGSEYGLYGNVVTRRISHGELFSDVTVLHRDGSEIVERVRGGKPTCLSTCSAGALHGGGRAASRRIAPAEEAAEGRYDGERRDDRFWFHTVLMLEG